LRLTATSAGLTLVILVIFGAVIGNLAADRIRGDFNHELENAVATLASQVRIVDTPTDTLIIREPHLNDFVSPNDATARIFNAHGVPLDASPGAADLGPPIQGTHDIGEMRVVTATLRSSQTGRIAGYVQYARDEGSIDTTIDRLWVFIAAGVFGATVLAFFAGLAIANRAMRPIAALTSSAREIAETRDPSRRMPDPKADDEVGELARTLEQMLRSLDAARSERERALQKQREFVADASHELRTPLTSVLANLELLQTSLESPRQAEDREMVDSALRSSRRMGRLVTDLLLLARADAGRLGEHRRCDLAEIVGNTAAEVSAVMGGRRLEIDNEHPVMLEGNPDELHRMVVNLLDNAARHTPADAKIGLSLRVEGGNAILEVSDDGPGIPAEFREQVFDRFVRVDGPADTASGDGTGLGLAIVKSVASSHHGTVEVAESDSGGALFRVRLPRASASSEPSVTRPLEAL
jgi:signal transduction histidine kinase